CDTAPFDNVDVRNALKMSINREELVEKITFGAATVGNDFHHSPAMPYWPDDIEQTPYDPEQAKALLKKAGMENLEVNFDLLTSTRDQEIDTFGFNFIGTTEASGTLVDPQINVRTVEGMAFDEYFAGTITVPATNATGFGSGGSSQYNQDTTVERDTLSTGVNIAWENELWRASGDISFSEAEGDEQIFAGTVHGAPSGGFGGPTFTLTYNALGEDPTLSVLEDLTDPSIFVPRQFEELRLANEDELTAFQFDLERNFDSAGITRISAGLRFTDREKTFDRISNRFTSAVIPDDPTLVLDDSFVVGVATPENGPQYLAWDLGRLRSRFQQMIPQADAALPAPLAENTQLLESGAIQEDSLSGYVQLDFDTELGGLPFSGNVGLRYVDTDLSAPGWSTPSRETVPAFQITPEHSYFEWLPSANFALELTDTQLLRLGLGTVLNRPPLDDMRSSESIFISGFGANGNAGNPMLDPTVADQISLSYEWYPKDATSLVVAVYYNDLESFVGTEFVTRPVVDVGGTPVDVVFQVPGNGDGGYIRGYEFSINTTFGFITEALESFGTSFNYAFTESNVLPVAPGGVGASLTGLSEDVGNLALWWVGGKFEARIGWDYRSEYIEPNAFGNFLNVDDTLLTSFQISYDINEDIRVGLFGRNIGDEVRRKFSFNIPDRTEFNQSFREVYGVRLFWQF
ncbi:MAG: TonB-dependent receptor, partial [Pseudomonadota bacterium]